MRGSIIGVIKGDTWSVDLSSYANRGLEVSDLGFRFRVDDTYTSQEAMGF